MIKRHNLGGEIFPLWSKGDNDFYVYIYKIEYLLYTEFNAK